MRGFSWSCRHLGNKRLSWAAAVADSTLLFVYGSLKRGRRHHAELGGARFAGVARTLPEYRLLELGEYPALASGCRSIEGELFQVTEALLVELDRFEGDDYERGAVRLEGGRTALAYFARAVLVALAPVFDGDVW
jgi:gamma-glutamylaminecyclotransferase